MKFADYVLHIHKNNLSSVGKSSRCLLLLWRGPTGSCLPCRQRPSWRPLTNSAHRYFPWWPCWTNSSSPTSLWSLPYMWAAFCSSGTESETDPFTGTSSYNISLPKMSLDLFWYILHLDLLQSKHFFGISNISRVIKTCHFWLPFSFVFHQFKMALLGFILEPSDFLVVSQWLPFETFPWYCPNSCIPYMLQALGQRTW